MDPLRGADQALAVGVLADLEQDLADRRLDPAVRRVATDAVALDQRGRPARLLADLGLDLVDDALDVIRQVRRARHGGLLCRPRWYVPHRSLIAGRGRAHTGHTPGSVSRFA